MLRRRMSYVIIMISLLISLPLEFGAVEGDSPSITIPLIELGESASTNPSLPVILSQDVEIADAYLSEETCYYYQTSVTGYSHHVIWVAPHSPEDDFQLLLHDDSAYSNLIAASMRGPGLIDWVVYSYDGSTPYYYPVVYTQLGSVGSGYIEWDVNSLSPSLGVPVIATPNASDFIEIYTVSLSMSSNYDFTLEASVTGDYDLYLYQLETGEATGWSGYIAKSSTVGIGADESILNFNPVTGVYVILIVLTNGTGSFTFLYDYSQTYTDNIRGFEIMSTLFGLLAILLLLGVTRILKIGRKIHALS